MRMLCEAQHDYKLRGAADVRHCSISRQQASYTIVGCVGPVVKAAGMCAIGSLHELDQQQLCYVARWKQPSWQLRFGVLCSAVARRDRLCKSRRWHQRLCSSSVY